MAADELLILNIVSLCQQNVAQMTRAFQNVAANTAPVDFKCSGRKIETQGQLRTREKLLNKKVALGGCIYEIISASTSRFGTTWTADATLVFERPPKRSRIAKHVAKDLRMTQGDVR